MQVDKITFNDISIFHHEEEFSIFHKLNFTRTVGGKEQLRLLFSQPHTDIKKILGTQQIIRCFLQHVHEWPQDITNGTILVIDKYLGYPIDRVSDNTNAINSLTYKLLHSADYSMIKFSVPHFADFLRGLGKIISLLDDYEQLPASISVKINRISSLLREEPLSKLADTVKGHKFTTQENTYYGGKLREEYKNKILELIGIYSHLEAWYSMAVAVKNFNLKFPEFIEAEEPAVNFSGLYHLLLSHPVSYDLSLDSSRHLLFLTGANMAGKSTLIKAVGSAVFLAHLGMGVPANNMQLTVMDGLLTNINVEDNIAKGESYFFNEVQRIKNTIEKINTGKKWLVLIDELFKGTNVQDAMKCSLVVIKGLLRIKNSLFILSTHLYEIGDELKQYADIDFKYFETIVAEDQLQFTYQLKDGISNDRIGYVILKREKVVEMLEKI